MTPPRETTDPGSLRMQFVMMQQDLRNLCEHNDSDHIRISAAIESIITRLDGNGTGAKGLCTRLTSLETANRILWAITGSVAAAALGLAAALLVKLVH